jgi:signal transduction histidine kinase
VKLRSLRARVLLGVVLGALGTLGVAHVFSMTLIVHFPAMRLVGHAPLVAIAVALIAAGLWHARVGLAPLDDLRRRLAAVRSGKAARLEGTYPSEVEPLVQDLNALLAHREQLVLRALAKAGDLAHGLKTPLAVLFQEAERARRAGHHELAESIHQQAERMSRQVDYQLAQARAAAAGAAPGTGCLVLASAEGLARTFERLHAERGLALEVRVASGHAVAAERQDLDEMLGNLLDNAYKWARSRIVVTSEPDGTAVHITVEDDGPGLDPSLREAVLTRGVRADEAAPGAGLGLAIVRELAELYGGGIALEAAPMGGLRARLRLPGR